jgi:glycine cleavage system aminomethyltransferase T
MTLTLDFLSPAGAPAGVLARSPIEGMTKAAGARYEARDGWNVAVEYAGGRGGAAAASAVAWADVSHLRKLELQAPAETLDQTGRLALGEAVRSDGAWWCRLTATRALIVGGSEPVPGALDVSCNFGALTVLGPLARETFARFCALDLRPERTPVRALRPGSIGRQPGILIREDEHRYLFLFGSATGEYMWSTVADAGGHLGGAPVGVDQLPPLPVGTAAGA